MRAANRLTEQAKRVSHAAKAAPGMGIQQWDGDCRAVMVQNQKLHTAG